MARVITGKLIPLVSEVKRIGHDDEQVFNIHPFAPRRPGYAPHRGGGGGRGGGSAISTPLRTVTIVCAHVCAGIMRAWANNTTNVGTKLVTN